jgi:hypothetical protein
MLAIYQRLTAEGKIGPFDAEGRPKPYQEYPKMVRDAAGTERIVHSQREELAVAADTSVQPSFPADDPLLRERDALAEENEKLRMQLAAIGGAAAPTAPLTAANVPIEALTPKAPVGLAKKESEDGRK